MDKKEFVILHKNSSKFYYAYEYDAFILNYLFGYKVLDKNKCGFPDNSINRVINKLEEAKISYQIIYNDKDPVVKNYRKNNNYQKILEKAQKKMKLSTRTEIIINKIKEMSENELETLIEKLEQCIK